MESNSIHMNVRERHLKQILLGVFCGMLLSTMATLLADMINLPGIAILALALVGPLGLTLLIHNRMKVKAASEEKKPRFSRAKGSSGLAHFDYNLSITAMILCFIGSYGSIFLSEALLATLYVQEASGDWDFFKSFVYVLKRFAEDPLGTSRIPRLWLGLTCLMIGMMLMIFIFQWRSHQYHRRK